VTTVLLDTHTLFWYSSQATALSDAAHAAIHGADELAVSGVTWWELAMLAGSGRIELAIPVASWLRGVSDSVRTVPVSHTIGLRAAFLPAPFPRDPMDRIIFATAVEHGWRLVTKDRRLRDFPQKQLVTLW
jgi:PIN domain nuclease of toxin-antitoxin system